MRVSRVICCIVILLISFGCNKFWHSGGNKEVIRPPQETLGPLQQIGGGEYEHLIHGQDQDTDSFLVGSLIKFDGKKCQLLPLNSYLLPGAKPKFSPKTEIKFKGLLDNQQIASINALEFIKSQVSDNKRSEVTLSKVAVISINKDDLDMNKLLSNFENIPDEERKKYGVILSSIHLNMTASFFKDSGTPDTSFSAYGVKIGGKWYTKIETTETDDMTIAVWSPLPEVFLSKKIVPVSNPEPPSASIPLSGEWIGVFRELTKAPNEEIVSEGVTLDEKDGYVKGNNFTSEGRIRRWAFDGQYKNNFLIVKFMGTRDNKFGGVAYVLRREPNSDTFRGYWTGLDPDNDMLVTCPYVLSKSTDVDKVKNENNVWLGNHCYPMK